MSSCQHNPLQSRTTLHVESNGSQVRIRCVVCDCYVMVSRNGVVQHRSSSTPERSPAPLCFWCGCEKDHPDHKFGAGKHHAYRVGSIVTKEEREAYALNR
jgi:hypothetical protein